MALFNKLSTTAVLIFLPIVLSVISSSTAAVADPAELARGHGYDAETHTARTEDGYLLSVFRIRNASAESCRSRARGRDPVLVVPGLACSAAIWVLLGPNKALAYLLADRCHDVWLADYRGGMFSRRHVNLTDGDAAFWDFSFDDIGRKDLPAVLQLVTGASGRPAVTYIGHSMGASVLSVLASGAPSLAALVSRAYLLAPAAFMGHASQPVVYGSAGAVARLHSALGLFASGEIPLNSWWMHWTIQSVCSNALTTPTCLLLGGVFSGHDSDQINKTEIPFYVQYIPDSISVKNVRHFTQHFGKERDFRQFDYGIVGNMAAYGEHPPPSYNLSKSTFPVSIYYGSNDFLVNPQDVNEFSRSLPNEVRRPYQVQLEKFSHIDFFLATDAKTLLYDKMIEDMEDDERRASKGN